MEETKYVSKSYTSTVQYRDSEGCNQDGAVILTLTYPRDLRHRLSEESISLLMKDFEQNEDRDQDAPKESKKVHYDDHKDDPAVRHYQSETLTYSAHDCPIYFQGSGTELEKINATFFKHNVLDLSNCDLEAYDYLYKASVRLDTIRVLNVAGSVDANQFLANLFSSSASLRSLKMINVHKTNVSLNTLQLWLEKKKTGFNGPLIRNGESFSQGQGGYMIRLVVKGVTSTPVMLKTTRYERLKIHRPSVDKFDVLYKHEGFKTLRKGHLQILLK